MRSARSLDLSVRNYFVTVRYEVKKKAKFTPISLLDSSDEDEEEPIKETPSEAGSDAATPKGLH